MADETVRERATPSATDEAFAYNIAVRIANILTSETRYRRALELVEQIRADERERLARIEKLRTP